MSVIVVYCSMIFPVYFLVTYQPWGLTPRAHLLDPDQLVSVVFVLGPSHTLKYVAWVTKVVWALLSCIDSSALQRSWVTVVVKWKFNKLDCAYLWWCGMITKQIRITVKYCLSSRGKSLCKVCETVHDPGDDSWHQPGFENVRRLSADVSICTTVWAPGAQRYGVCLYVCVRQCMTQGMTLGISLGLWTCGGRLQTLVGGARL